MHDRVGEDPADACVALHDGPGVRDVVVREHVLVGPPRWRRQQRDRRVAPPEDARDPLGRGQQVGVDLVAPAGRVDHVQVREQGRRARRVGSARTDEMGLHVDDEATGAERRVGGGCIDLGLRRHGVEAGTGRGVERAQGRGGPPTLPEILAGIEAEARSVPGRGFAGRVGGLPLRRSEPRRVELVRGTRREERRDQPVVSRAHGSSLVARTSAAPATAPSASDLGNATSKPHRPRRTCGPPAVLGSQARRAGNARD